ncbi:hypothetical protein LUZ60_013587 [Juncus effusus]|nr:hypothetical protein LUZ60_013587 [Juncus effusus]
MESKSKQREETEGGCGDDVASGCGGGAVETPAMRAPSDVMSRVFCQLDCVDLLNCSLVCKQWYIESMELREGWKSEYLEASAIYCLGIKHDTHPPHSSCSIRGLHCWCP